jgi:hypothetical protein
MGIICQLITGAATLIGEMVAVRITRFILKHMEVSINWGFPKRMVLMSGIILPID